MGHFFANCLTRRYEQRNCPPFSWLFSLENCRKRKQTILQFKEEDEEAARSGVSRSKPFLACIKKVDFLEYVLEKLDHLFKCFSCFSFFYGIKEQINKNIDPVTL